MTFFSANPQDLEALYLRNLQKALDMEDQIVKALPAMIEKAEAPRLCRAFSNHLDESRSHVAKLERLLASLGENESVSCKVATILIDEARSAAKASGEDSLRDLTLLAAAQQIEHHEMAVYGTLCTWAAFLGRYDHADILETILADERHTDTLLAGIAGRVNATTTHAMSNAA